MHWRIGSHLSVALCPLAMARTWSCKTCTARTAMRWMLPGSQSTRVKRTVIGMNVSTFVSSAGRHLGFLIVLIKGGIAHHMMKQLKKANHAKWNARMCGRSTLKRAIDCFLKFCWL